MGLSLRRNGLSVRVDGLNRRGTSGDACCCEAEEIACTCGYEVVDDENNPTTGTIIELALSSSATPSDSTNACWLSDAISRIVGLEIGLVIKSDTPGNQRRLFERTFTLSPSVTVCGRSWNRMYVFLDCQTPAPANIGWTFGFQMFDTGSASDQLYITNAGSTWKDVFGNCCGGTSTEGFFITTTVSGVTNSQDNIDGEWEFFVVSGPC